jgi:hypothetical protein
LRPYGAVRLPHELYLLPCAEFSRECDGTYFSPWALEKLGLCIHIGWFFAGI